LVEKRKIFHISACPVERIQPGKKEGGPLNNAFAISERQARAYLWLQKMQAASMRAKRGLGRNKNVECLEKRTLMLWLLLKRKRRFEKKSSHQRIEADKLKACGSHGTSVLSV